MSGDTDVAARIFAEQRDRLVGVAYRLLGRVTDAEDVVQEAWLRWSHIDVSEVNDAPAYLVRVTSRLALDRLRRIKARREDYVGPWLPEPLLTSDDVAEDVALADSVSMALLVVLETLSPLERAVFVLREAFAMSHAEIASILDRSEPAVRQLARRAREHVDERRPRFEADLEQRRRVTERFIAAAGGGDLNELMGVLAPDVRLIADSGGKAIAPRVPIEGAEKVAHFLGASARGLAGATYAYASVNGGPAVLVHQNGRLAYVVTFEVADELVQQINVQGNPDKLRGVSARQG